MDRWNATFPGMLPYAHTYAAWPVWGNSTSGEVRFQSMSKRQAHRLWHEAREFERQTREPGRQDGILGRNGLAIVHVLLFDFLNYRSGRLDPSHKEIAEKANISESSVDRGMVKVKAAGVLTWLRRCVEAVAADGSFLLRQISNAYHVCSTANWKGYKPREVSPSPDPSCWGARPPDDPYAEAKGDMVARLMVLEAEAKAGSGVAGVYARDLRRRLKSSTTAESVSLMEKPYPPSIQE
jgi:hypothetical protein